MVTCGVEAHRSCSFHNVDDLYHFLKQISFLRRFVIENTALQNCVIFIYIHVTTQVGAVASRAETLLVETDICTERSE